MTFELNGRSSAVLDDGRETDGMKGKVESKDFATVSVKSQTQRPSFAVGSISEQQTQVDSDGDSLSRRRSPNAFDSGSEAYLYSDPELLGTWGSKNRKANTSTGTAATKTNVILSAAASTSDGSTGHDRRNSGSTSSAYASMPSYVNSLLATSTPSTVDSGTALSTRSKGAPTLGNFSAVTTTSPATSGWLENSSEGTQSFLKRLGSVRSRKPQKPEEDRGLARN
ncbi:unnamed protein product [Schistocephalus solidus]|uniref:Uncharacterized protein n=1 Tax=Schistocephalus solidus TaxID=70667 RepID=A0A3P7CSK0_SCHSO|nr:unnamed protein product [Schistocephalus solidus]